MKTVPPFKLKQQLKAPPSPPMSKREFMQQYVLTRASTVTENFDAVTATDRANTIWNRIEEHCK